MDQRYGNSVHMAAMSMQQQNSSQQHYQNQNHQYQFYQDYTSDACYPSSAYHDVGYPGEQYAYHPTSSVPYGTGIESYLDPKYATNPAAFASRLPYLPFHAAAAAAYGMYDYSFEPAFIRKRNERERQRVKCVNEGYARLREHLPEEYAEKRLSKVETLRGAILYIRQLQTVLGVDPEKKEKEKKSEDKSKNPSEEKSEEEKENEETIAEMDLADTEETTHCDSTMKFCSKQTEAIKDPVPPKGKRRILPSCAFESIEKTSEKNSNRKNQIELEPSRNSCSKDSERSRESVGSNSTHNSCMVSEYLPCMKQGLRSCAEESQNTQMLHHAVEKCSDGNDGRFSQCSYSDSRRASLQNEVIGRKENNLHSCSLNSSRIQSGSSSIPSPQDLTNSTSCEIRNKELLKSPYWSHNLGKRNAKQSGHNDFYPSYTQHHVFDNDSSSCQSGRYHPYCMFETSYGKTPNKWNGSIYVKTEIHTPPPCVGYEDFTENNENYHSTHLTYHCAGISQSILNGNQISRNLDYIVPRGGQSDGFKSDTSPVSSTGNSP